MDEGFENSNIQIHDKLILPVKSIRQSYSWDCGPTCLRMAIQYQFGLKLTANDIIFLSGATENGTNEYNFIKALDILGFNYRQTDHGTFSMLKYVLHDGQIPIVHVMEKDGIGHYMSFCGYDEENQFVWLADPAPSKARIVKYATSYFLGIWKIDEKETQTRWFLAITGYIDDKVDSSIRTLRRIQKKVKNSRK